MFLQDIFDNLTSGEYRDHLLGGSRSLSKTVGPDQYYLVIPAINQGVLELHKRLNLRTDVVTVELHEAISLYVLHRDFAQTNTASTKPVKYIADSQFYPFTGNLVSIEQVFDTCGNEYPINDQDLHHSVFIPRYNTVQHPCPEQGEIMDITYRATIDRIPKDFSGDPAEYELDIPDYVMAPLLKYIQARTEVGMIRGENIQAEQAALIQFEMACQLIEQQGLVHTRVATRHDICAEGWR